MLVEPVGGRLQRDNLQMVSIWNHITGLSTFRYFSKKWRSLVQVILQTVDCQLDPFNKCHCGLSHTEFYDISGGANVETDFDLKNAQVILNYFVPESILFVRHSADSRYYNLIIQDGVSKEKNEEAKKEKQKGENSM